MSSPCRKAALLLVATSALLAACGASDAAPAPVKTTTIPPATALTTAAPATTLSTATVPTATPTTAAPITTTPTPTLVPPEPPVAPLPGVVEVRYRVERRVRDEATEGFEEVVAAVLADRRGWSSAGFALVEDRSAPYAIVLAEGDEVDRLCLPYRTGGTYSCQNGPVVALNADRWRSATPQWTGDLSDYRTMLVNHEVGHLLGQHHPPSPQCPEPGVAALVMAQQSTELDGCLANPWPLAVEIERAAAHVEELAPPFQER